MPTDSDTNERLCHSHAEEVKTAREERRIRWVVAVTLLAMFGELTVGLVSGSLALVAEGWHMACHAGALGLAALAYWFARTRARDAAFTFGTGKVHALAGYTNAILLLGVSILTIVEGARRLFAPVHIDFREALPAAIAGLVVNVVCVRLLDVHHHDHDEHHHEHNHNLRAAYLHVLGDLITSVAAVVALVGARYAGWRSLDPLMAVVSSVVVLKWGVSLVRTSGGQLLDVAASTDLAHAIRERVETLDGARVVDLHLWQLGPGRHGCILSIVSPIARPLDDYRAAVHAVVSVGHLTIEIAPS
ncbi:MAG TPA: CDF family Co(II)/Ni(II) efflux transporter DmeF [Polyangia bacterium]|nr:CDF family Co(II)/Ni(II) efflux transporter DmeF [Polyangia bacterium]